MQLQQFFVCTGQLTDHDIRTDHNNNYIADHHDHNYNYNYSDNNDCRNYHNERNDHRRTSSQGDNPHRYKRSGHRFYL